MSSISGSEDYSRFQFRPGNVIHQFRIIRPYRDGVFKEVYLVEKVPQLSLEQTDTEEKLMTVLKLFKRDADIKSASASAEQNLVMLEQLAQAGGVSEDPRVIKFFKEIGALYALQKTGGHDNIAKIVDAGVYSVGENAPAHLYFVEEFVEGDTLAQLWERQTPNEEGLKQMSPDTTLGIFEPVACGVKYLHENEMTHGDLQPKNILITPEHADGEGRIIPIRPVITDFGNAHVVTDEEYRQVGSILYRSPEELVGMPGTQSSDVWAVGIMLYVGLTGRYPFNVDLEQWATLTADEKRDAEERLKVDIAYDRIEPVTRYNPAVSDALSDIVRSALRRHPDQRIGAKSLHTKLANERKRLLLRQTPPPINPQGPPQE
ncbi:serine/threonine protein kinase [archaeon]|nr:serine/threonine protein kinase [archaeon]